MGLVNGMIEETQRKAALAGRRRDQMMNARPDQGNGDVALAYSQAQEPEPVPVIDETLPKLKQLKAQIQKTMKSK